MMIRFVTTFQRNSLCALACFVLLTQTTSAQQFQIDMNQFDSWMFNNLRDETQTRKMLQSAIDLEISRIDKASPLDDAQKQRIRLAGKGDVKRFFDRVDKARRDFTALGDQLNQNNINEAYQLASPVQQELNKGLFGEKSLLQKVVNGSMDEEQAETMRIEKEKRNRRYMETMVKMWLAELGRQIPMTAEQRDGLFELAIARVNPVEVEGRYLTYYIAYRMSKMPDEKLENLLDEHQLVALRRTFRTAKAWEGMLRQQGLLDDE